MEKKYFVVVSPYGVGVYDSLEQLFNIVYYYPTDYCEIFTVKSPEEATLCVHNMYVSRFVLAPENMSANPMAIPSSGCFSLMSPKVRSDPALVAPNNALLNLNEEYTLQNPNTPTWAITFMVGFGIENDLNNLMYRLDTLEYPHAVRLPNEDLARTWVIRKYFERFCKMFDMRDTCYKGIDRPINTGEIYTDERFTNGVIEVSENAVFDKLRRYGVI